MTTSTKRTKKNDATAKPALHIQVGGIRIPLWRNEGEGGTYYKAGQPELSYRSRDGKWHAGKSYGSRDLINLIKAAAIAHSEVTRRNRAERPSDQDEATD